MISQTTEYALRAMVTLAKQPEQLWKTKEIAKLTQIPSNYLVKVLQNLVRHHLVTSQRGVNGGVTLARSADEITVLQIVNAVDPIARITKCSVNLKSHNLYLCPLHKKLDQVLSQVERVFASTTLEELIQPSRETESGKPCGFPFRAPGKRAAEVEK